MPVRKKVAFYSLDLSNTFNELLYQGVLDGVKDRGMELAVIHGGQLQGPHSFETGRNFLYKLFNHQDFDGLILPNIFSFIPEDEQSRMVASLSPLPLVTIGHQVAGHPSILVDNRSGFSQLITHLIEVRKIKKFGLITGPRYHHDSIERLETFYSTLENHGIPWDKEREYEGTWGLTSGSQGARYLFNRTGRDMEALICFNDTMAIGALQEITRQGLKCPRDILLTGFDNTYESRNTNPPLSTISFPVYQMGRLAVLELDKILKKETPAVLTDAVSRVVISRVQLRRSTGDDTMEGAVNLQRLPLKSPHAGAFIPGGVVETALVSQFLEMARGLWTDTAIQDLRQNIRDMVHQLSATLERGQPDLFIHFCRDLFHTWLQEGKDLEPWNYILENLAKNIRTKDSLINRQALKQTITEGLFVLQETESIALTNERIQERIFTTRILDLGEELSAAFTEQQILRALQSFLPDVGIHKCLLVRMDPKKTPLTGKIFMDWGASQLDWSPSEATKKSEVLAHPRLLTQDFLNNVPHYLIEPLQVRDEFIGYMAVDLPFQPGLLIKNLRFQISTSLIISELIREIQAHSQSLEDRVAQRTTDLKTANDKLLVEMNKREKVESELIRSRNLESLGLLAGGIAHDFNNLLTAIMGNASLLDMGNLEPGEVEHCVRDILNASLRARDLTQQLLTFSKGGSPIKSRTSLALVVEETARFTLRGQSTKPDFTFPADLWDVEADKGQLSQVVNNIVINAVQAMPQGGMIHFTAENLKLVESDPPLVPGDYVKLIIRDEGPGIPEIVVERIFDPYFTTKKDGNGLGLATSLGIIKRHGGQITVDTGLHKGTAFIIILPKARHKPDAEPTHIKSQKTTQLKILLLEDQETVKTVMVKLLEELGHQVITACDGQTAVELFQKAEETKPMDLAILDLVIPGGLGGADTLKILRSLKPELYAIASSGYSEQGGIGNFSTMGFNALLPKPFQLDDIRRVLGDYISGRKK